jgi:hypothetical protein
MTTESITTLISLAALIIACLGIRITWKSNRKVAAINQRANDPSPLGKARRALAMELHASHRLAFQQATGQEPDAEANRQLYDAAWRKVEFMEQLARLPESERPVTAKVVNTDELRRVMAAAATRRGHARGL